MRISKPCKSMFESMTDAERISHAATAEKDVRHWSDVAMRRFCGVLDGIKRKTEEDGSVRNMKKELLTEELMDALAYFQFHCRHLLEWKTMMGNPARYSGNNLTSACHPL